MADYTSLAGGQSSSFVVQSAATGPIIGKTDPDSWLDYQHPHYTRMMPKWKLVQDFYEGEVANIEVGRFYLQRRYQGEPQAAYDERLSLADYTPHLGTIVDSLGGMMFSVEDRATRVWSTDDQIGLGDPNEVGTMANSLWWDADGLDTAWTTIWRQFAIDLIAYTEMWVIVDSHSAPNDRPVVKLVRPTMVPNWIAGATGATTVLMKEEQDVRTSIEQEPDCVDTWIKWSLDGWTRWRKDKDGVAVQLVGAEGAGTYKYVDREGDPALPVFQVRLPMRRYVTWLLAKKANVIFNLESVRDFGLRNAGFGKLKIGVETQEQFEGIKQMIMDGNNVIPQSKDAPEHAYINPPSEPTVNAGAVLDKKIEHFWISGFKMYGDAVSAGAKTATEVKQDVSSGVGAFLQLLKAAVDDAENGAFYRLEQAEFSESPGKWGVAHVERSDDFSTVDLDSVLDQMRKRYLGETEVIPVGRSALIQMAKNAAQQDGLPVDDDEITVAVDSYLLNKFLGPMTQIDVMPATVKARLTMKMVAALGLVDAKEEVEMADGEKLNLFTVLMASAEKLASQQELTQQQLSQASVIDAQRPSPSGFGGAH